MTVKKKDMEQLPEKDESTEMMGKGVEHQQYANKKTALNSRSLTPKTIRRQAIRCLYDMIIDEELKPSERLSAIKVALDYSEKLEETQKRNDSSGTMNVVFENIPPEYAE